MESVSHTGFLCEWRAAFRATPSTARLQRLGTRVTYNILRLFIRASFLLTRLHESKTLTGFNAVIAQMTYGESSKKRAFFLLKNAKYKTLILPNPKPSKITTCYSNFQRKKILYTAFRQRLSATQVHVEINIQPHNLFIHLFASDQWSISSKTTTAEERKRQRKRTKIIKNTVMTQQIQQHYHKPASFL